MTEAVYQWTRSSVWLERQTHNLGVVGSSPTGSTMSNLGQKIIDGLEDFVTRLRTGKSIKATKVCREETPDGPLHTFKQVEMSERTMELEFKERWPKWFDGLDGSPMKTCLAFGFECGEGWKDLLWCLCEDIEKLGPHEEFCVHQVKEKFGGLRFYTSGCSNEIHDRVSQAEQESYNTCETCGSTEEVTSEGSWVKTLCKKCRKPNEGND